MGPKKRTEKTIRPDSAARGTVRPAEPALRLPLGFLPPPRASEDLFSASLNQQCRRHPPFFRGQDVVGSAGRSRIHHFDSDAGLDQAAGEAGMGKAQGRAGAEQHHLGLERKQELKVTGRELLERFRLPALDDAVGQDDHALLVALLVDGDIAGSITGEQVVLDGTAKMQFHAGLHLRQIDRSGNITSFLRCDKGPVSEGFPGSAPFRCSRFLARAGHERIRRDTRRARQPIILTLLAPVSGASGDPSISA